MSLVKHNAAQLALVIESQAPAAVIGQAAEALVSALGGNMSALSQMTPGAAALYIQALTLSAPIRGVML